jgi:alkanesulfonate monooxygenase SsuD/methylene tetrahydromethanopterin reductase-like flavin-dependent oxidoreductase (luciferase family)
MRYGIVILPERRWSETRQLWRRAEELGFDHVWTHDHLMGRWPRAEPSFSCLPTLTAAATVTSRIKLGTLVATPAYRHPVPFAKEMMTLDDISAGRLICGLGSGTGEYDEEALDSGHLTPYARASRFEEFVKLTDLLLRQPVTDYSGPHYSAWGVPMLPGCVQRPRVPFAIAGAGPRAMRLAAQYGELWVTNGAPGSVDAMHYREALPLLRKQMSQLDDACTEAGREPETLGRLLLTGATVGGVLDSVEAFRDAAGLLAGLGFTDLVIDWPGSAHPQAGGVSVLEEIARAKLSFSDNQ